MTYLHRAQQQTDQNVGLKTALSRRRLRSSASLHFKPSIHHTTIVCLSSFIAILIFASTYSSLVVAASFGNYLATDSFQRGETYARRMDVLTARHLIRRADELDDTDLDESIVDSGTESKTDDYEDETGIDQLNNENDETDADDVDSDISVKANRTNQTDPDALLSGSSSNMTIEDSSVPTVAGESAEDDVGAVLVNSTITHYASDFGISIESNTTDSVNLTNKYGEAERTNLTRPNNSDEFPDLDDEDNGDEGSESDRTSGDDIDQPSLYDNDSKSVTGAKEATNITSEVVVDDYDEISNVSESTFDTATNENDEGQTDFDGTQNSVDDLSSSYSSEINEDLRNKSNTSENNPFENTDDNNDNLTREETLEGVPKPEKTKEATTSEETVGASSESNANGDGLISNNVEDEIYDPVLGNSNLDLGSDEAGTADNSQLMRKINTEEIEFEVVLIVFGCISLVLMITTAYQMSENPDGMYASICRFTISIILSIWSFLRYPFCKPKMGTGRTNRQSYGHLPLSTKEYGYNDPALEIH